MILAVVNKPTVNQLSKALTEGKANGNKISTAGFASAMRKLTNKK